MNTLNTLFFRFFVIEKICKNQEVYEVVKKPRWLKFDVKTLFGCQNSILFSFLFFELNLRGPVLSPRELAGTVLKGFNIMFVSL
jgi:hypothetical protein